MTKVSEGLRIARENGDQFYFGETPCKRGNYGPRYTKGSICARDECKLVYAKGREKNREHHKKKNDEYQVLNRDKIKAKKKIYDDKNAEKVSKKKKHLRATDPDFDNREKMAKKRYKEKNPHYSSKANATRRNNLLLASMKWDEELTDFVAGEAVILCKMREKITGFKWQLDHMYPIKCKKVCGLHVWNNFQVIPKLLNNKKLSRFLFINTGDWILDNKGELK